MMKTLRYLIYMWSTLVALASCQRQELEDSYQFLAQVPVTIDWSEANLETTGVDKIANVSIVFYPTNGGEPVTKISDNLTYNLVTLPIGEYSVLIYNDIYNNIRNVTFEETNSFDNIAAHITEDTDTTPLFYTSDEETTLALDHGRVAWHHIDSFVVDDSMVEYTRSEEFSDYWIILKGDSSSEATTKTDMPTVKSLSTTESKSVTKSLETLMDVKPQPQTTTVTVTVRVENLDNAVYEGALYSFTAITHGFAHGSYFTKDEPYKLSEELLTYYNVVTSYTFDDNGVDGYVTYSFNSFGRSEEDEYSISFNIIELSGELFQTECDITEQVRNAIDLTTISIDLNDDEEKITLPPYEGVGFNVEGWGNNETVYL